MVKSSRFSDKSCVLSTITVNITLLLALFLASSVSAIECTSNPDNTPLLWTASEWKKHFGELYYGTTDTRLESNLSFGFHHFSTPSESGTDKQPLILLLGHSSLMSQWDPMILYRLKSCYDVYLIDNLGIGHSRFSGSQEEIDSKLEGMTWEDIGGFVHQAIEGIKSSQHCSDPNTETKCSLLTLPANGMGWAMGGKVLFEGAAQSPQSFNKLINLGGNIANNQGATGPNPNAVETLEKNPVFASLTAFFIHRDAWGKNQWFGSWLQTTTRTSPNFFADQNRAVHPNMKEKLEQGRASTLSNTALDEISHEVFLAWGKEDDLNFCYPANGDRYAEVCESGHYCVDGILCNEQAPRPTCKVSGLFGLNSTEGCRWGLAPRDDFYWADKQLTNSARVCEQGFTGAHGFPAQSQEAVISSVKAFMEGTLVEGMNCR